MSAQVTALMLAHSLPGRVLSFTDIEGNVAPEDCFLSCQIVEHARPDAESFFADFIDHVRRAPACASALHADSLSHKVRPGAVRAIFGLMADVEQSGRLVTSPHELR